MTSLSDFTENELSTLDFLKDEKPFRARQIFKNLAKGKILNEMTELPESLKKSCPFPTFKSRIENFFCDDDGTVKLQIALFDGCAIESVILKDKNERKTLCISSQVGCAMKCAFCKTGLLGFKRNLSAGEITEQFFLAEKKFGKIDNIVFMGMGEPLLNANAVKKSIEILTSKSGRNFSIRRITISTSGILEGIYDFAKNGPYVRLALSLTCANENLRKNLMPLAAKNSTLKELKNALLFYSQKSSRRITLEAVLLSDVNTNENCAKDFSDFASGLNANVNLITWNKVNELPFKSPTRSEIEQFVKILRKNKINVTIREKRGNSVNAACGQLGKFS